MSTAATALTFAPLSQKLTVQQARSIREEARAGAFGKPTATRVRNSRRDGLLLTGVLGGFIVLIFAILAVVRAFRGDDPAVGFAVTGGLALIVVAIYLVGSATSRRSWERTARLVTFARANDFTVQPVAKPRNHASRIFANRSHACTYDLVSWQQGNHHVETGRHWFSYAGVRADSHDVAYLAVSLDARLPRASFSCGRRLRAGADMTIGVDALGDDPAPRGRRPRLVCGDEDRARARAVFSDDLVALLTDDDHPADAELVDGWFFAYYGGGNNLDESWWRLRILTVETVLRNVAGVR